MEFVLAQSRFPGGGFRRRRVPGKSPSGTQICGNWSRSGLQLLENLFNEGFTIPDLDLIVVTHAHPDHIENLTNLLTLLWERNKRIRNQRRVNSRDKDRQTDLISPERHRVILALTEGVFERYSSLLQAEGSENYLKDIVVLKAEQWRGSQAGGRWLQVTIDNDKASKTLGECEVSLLEEAGPVSSHSVCRIRAMRAWHNDQTGHDSVGLTIEVGGDKAWGY